MIKKLLKKGTLAILALCVTLLLSGCASNAENTDVANPTPDTTIQSGKKPPLPEKLSLNAEGVPLLKVYKTDEDTVEEMDIEQYLQGVLAGEMKNDWPIEALKAQAILARTFVLKFCTDKQSKYDGADISTDIEEAQAYDATGINDNILTAVNETRGEVLSHEGELPYAWFHAHSGGMTTSAKTGLDYEKDEPGYTKSTESMESDAAPKDAKTWTASFPLKEFLTAAKASGYNAGDDITDIKTGDTDESGRAVTILINGQPVSAPQLRVSIGSTKMRSTMLTKLALENETVTMAGKGYGHGVGMPQWGAYGMAESGKKAEEIVTYYFNDVTVETLW